MQTKALSIESMSEAGVGLAKIATLSAVDLDGDTYAPGAFGDGNTWVPLLTAHDRGGIPFGKARVYEEGDAAYAELHLNLDTQAGRDWHAALRFDLAKGNPVQEWSYGYEAVNAVRDMRGGQIVRVLQRLDISEVSTVVRGAGVGSQTISIKSAALKGDAFDALIASLGAVASAVKRAPEAVSGTGLQQLIDIHDTIGPVIGAVQERLKPEVEAIEADLPDELSDQDRDASEAAIAATLERETRRNRQADRRAA